MRIEKQLMQGPAPLAILQLLSTGEKYGYELIQRMEREWNGDVNR